MDKHLRPIAPVKLSSSVTPSPELGIMPVPKVIPLERLVVDSRYQRDAKRGKSVILKIVREFSWSRFQPITVAKMGDYFAIIDGQHRAIAARSHPSIGAVPCWVVPDERLELQAKAFVGINKVRTAITSAQIYFAGLAANDPDAIRLKRVCEKAGVSIARYANAVSNKPDHTVAVASIDARLRKVGERPVVEALKALREAYPQKPGQLSAVFIEVLANFFARYGDAEQFDRSRFVERLRECSLHDMLDGARQQRRIFGGSVASHMLVAMVRMYNNGLRQNRLSKSEALKSAA